jgi:alpha-beta hydrolase superfamily lysophospholipase
MNIQCLKIHQSWHGLLMASAVAFGTGSASAAQPSGDAVPWLCSAKNGRALQQWRSASGQPLPSGYVFPSKSGRVRAVLVCLHGIQTHAAWFSLLAEPLNAAGVTLFCPNRRGSGGAARVARIDTYGTWLKDLDPVVAAARAEGVPVYLLGTSWGAKLAMAYAGEHPERITGVILLVPALVTSVEKPYDRLLAALLDPIAWWWPQKLPLDARLYPPRPPDWTAIGKPPPRNAFSPRDCQFLAAMGDDPWIMKRASLHFVVAANAMQDAALKRWRHRQQGAPSIDVIYGGADQIVVHDRTHALLDGLTRSEEVVPGAGHAAQVQSVLEVARRIQQIIHLDQISKSKN